MLHRGTGIPMQKGQKVDVLDFRGRQLSRRVWEDAGRGVLVCTEEGYLDAVQSDDEPPLVGFPKQDVQLAVEAEKLQRNLHEQQRRSFAYGNTHFENSRITKEMIDKVAQDIELDKI